MCGAPCQHQPRRGRPSALIHSAGTRRSPQREPSSEKQLRSRRISGVWSTTAKPSAIVSGDLTGIEDRGQRHLGRHVEELRAWIEPTELVRLSGNFELADRFEPRQLVGGHVGEAGLAVELERRQGGQRIELWIDAHGLVDSPPSISWRRAAV